MPKNLFNVIGKVVATWEAREAKMVAVELPFHAASGLRRHGVKVPEETVTLPNLAGLQAGQNAKINLQRLEDGALHLQAQPHLANPTGLREVPHLTKHDEKILEEMEKKADKLYGVRPKI